MTDLFQRLRSEDPSALEELGHELLPFVQAAVLAHGFQLREPGAVLQLFREEVAAATRSSEPASFCSVVLGQVRARAGSLPALEPDPSQAEALFRLASLEPLPVEEREPVVARFVERLPEELSCRHYRLDRPALAAILSRGAALLVGPPAERGEDWSAQPSLLDPNGDPVPQFVELENVLTSLAIDVTALERQPLISPVPVLKPGFVPQVPQDHYPSKVVTQGFLDLPADVSGPSAEPTASGPGPRLWAAGPREEGTEPQGGPLEQPVPGCGFSGQAAGFGEAGRAGLLASGSGGQVAGAQAVRGPPADADTDARVEAVRDPLADPEATEARARPLTPFDPESTQGRGAPLGPRPSVVPHRGRQIDDGRGYFVEGVEQTEIGVKLTSPAAPLPFHLRLPPAWWWGAAALCAVLGVSLYAGMVHYLRGRVQRPWTMVPVIAAARDLPEGTRITHEQLAIRAIPQQNASVSVVKPESLAYAIGRTLEFPLQAGDPLLWSQFDGAQRYKRFFVIKSGRAYTIPVTELRSVGGQLLPNEEVDLVVSLAEGASQPGGKARSRALTLLQKVRVLSVGAVTTLNIGRVQRRFTDLTLMLVPEEVEVLSLAQRTGEITATLRNSDDQEVIGRGETTQQTLLSGIRLKALERRREEVISRIRSQQR